jgi:starch synthase
MAEDRNILMLAAENGALAGGKVGGLGDVISEMPPALARKGAAVSVVTPSYGFLHQGAGASPVRSLSFRFYGTGHQALVYEVQPEEPVSRVRHYVVDHPIFESSGDGSGSRRIYHSDPPEAPFATDATRFALFAAAAAEAIKSEVFGQPSCLHVHDWHAALLLILRQYDGTYQFLRSTRCVFTIHNLALQGVRPFEGSPSSLAAWYPQLTPPRHEIADPRWPNCVNPMAVGIRFANAVHTVSPTYADEIVNPSDPPRFFGGEGLESDLRAARDQGRLIGILNGCAYPKQRRVLKLSYHGLLSLLKEKVVGWAGQQSSLSSAHFVAHSRLTGWLSVAEPPAGILTSVTRAVEQKLLLMRSSGHGGVPALHRLLQWLGKRGIYILLGSGDPGYERFLIETSARFKNFIFLNGYSDEAAQALYASGDLFLMPSSFEPCGIGQMLAMREGQPCVVHGVGGLKDTVSDGVNGFSFGGHTLAEQADHFVGACQRALELKQADPDRWNGIRRSAAESRFTWDDAAAAYLTRLYR